MNNHTIRLEESYGNVTWMLNNTYSESLRKHSEENQKLFLTAYTQVMNKTMHFLAGCMALNPDMQTRYLNKLLGFIHDLACEGIEEVKKLKGLQ